MSPLFPSKAHHLASARRRSTLRLAATATGVAAAAITASGRAAPTDPTRDAAPRHHVRGDRTTTDTTATDTTRTDSTGVHVLGNFESPMV